MVLEKIYKDQEECCEEGTFIKANEAIDEEDSTKTTQSGRAF